MPTAPTGSPRGSSLRSRRRPTTRRPGERASPTDTVEGAAPVGHRVSAAAGPGWFLVGDAAGFLDPFTGEGIHRALVSAELAADAIDGLRSGRRNADPAAAAYQHAMQVRFRAKDRVSCAGPALPRPAAALRIRCPAAAPRGPVRARRWAW